MRPSQRANCATWASRYVDTTEPEEEIDVQEAIDKLVRLEKERDEAEAEMKKHLKELGFKVGK